MKAIETRYNGRLFRSRLEARWAVFFDGAWLQWDYETEGYMLPSGPYLPDFFLRIENPPHENAGYWVEIKPRGDPSERQLARVLELCIETGHNGFVVAGNPYPGEFACWKYSRHAGTGLLYHSNEASSRAWPWIPAEWLSAVDVPWEPDGVTIEQAFAAATSARFEAPRKSAHGFTLAGDVLTELRRGPRLGRAIGEAEARRSAKPRPEGGETA